MLRGDSSDEAVGLPGLRFGVGINSTAVARRADGVCSD